MSSCARWASLNPYSPPSITRRSPAATSPNSSCSGSAIISCGRLKQCTSQKPMTAWLRAISAPLETVLDSREAWP